MQIPKEFGSSDFGYVQKFKRIIDQTTKLMNHVGFCTRFFE